jgi:hypothetical protein
VKHVRIVKAEVNHLSFEALYPTGISMVPVMEEEEVGGCRSQ